MSRRRTVPFQPVLLALSLALALSTANFLSAQSEVVIHRLPSATSDGKSPSSGLAADGSGALYGVTQTGGIPCPQNAVGCGIAYKLTPPTSGSNWRETILYSFTGQTDGGLPAGKLLINSASHVIYGTAPFGGAKGNGVVFSLSPGNPWTETVLYSFKGAEGEQPITGVVLHKGDLYGAANGGLHGVGTLYRLRPPTPPGGSWQEQTLYQFTFGADGGFPFATPIFDSAGSLYGTTFNGPSGVDGTVYRLSPPSGGTGPWTLTTLYAFSGGADGGSPGGVVFDNSGTLYGTTEQGGAYGFGTVFQLAPPSSGTGPWTETVLYSFTGGTDGAVPHDGLIFDGSGNLYGVAGGGGDLSCGGGGCGAVFKLAPPLVSGGTWTESVEYAFQAGSDGYSPMYAPVLFKGTLFGTTIDGGGTNKFGIDFEITP